VVLGTLVLGIYPGFVLDLIGPSVDALISNFNHATAGLMDAAPAVASH